MSLQHGLPFTDVLLRYSPRWQDTDAFGVMGWIALAAVPFVLILLLARYEARLVPRPTAVRLIGLRLLVLLLILFLVLCQPVVAYPVRERPREMVIIAIDRSASMDVNDPQRAPLDKL